MTEFRRCDGHRDDDWPDEAAAERLLRGESVMSGDTRAARLARLIAAAAMPAAVDPVREEAAVAAFRDAFRGAFRGAFQGSCGEAGTAGLLPVVRLGRPAVPSGPAQTGRAAGARRSVKVSVGALVAAMALGAAAVAAVPGVLPVPFEGGTAGSAPARGGAAGSGAPDTSGTDGTDGGSSTPLTGGMSAAPPGQGTSSGPGRGMTPSQGRPVSPATPPASSPQPSHSAAPKAKGGEQDQQNVALCRAYVKAGGRMDAASSDRLAAAAGGKREVPKYCARVLAAAYTGSTVDGDSDHRQVRRPG
ncbi:hypothetical protein QMK19_10875 [Streptomyces sp. H10-C2]|uniref:hypothetical protein n=1 Tax=unclassified Streptomyces TaxID=2593676 RepID=UPI0024BBC02B|nr:MULTISPECIES: hypothetical protein [unclassified Streptomyces]MDJ0340513.1 hypothetical protein [Streptomyces sp. PH10-H1]MDJ0370161.1 hypothetical protein [Streptomyces sp. H10-C2]